MKIQRPRYYDGQSWHGEKINWADEMGEAVSDVAISPTLLQYRNLLVFAYYDADRILTIANRSIDGFTWSYRRLESFVGWDSHNYIALGFDRSGHLHVAGNMHASPLQYWIVDLSNPHSGVSRVDSLRDPQLELKITYPRFIRSLEGSLIFTYRNGISGDGDFMAVEWNEIEKRHQLVSEGPLIRGNGERNAYLDSNAPILGPDAIWHLLWVWRDSPNAETNHTINYACSPDLIQWRSRDGRLLNRPIALNDQSVVDPVPPFQGLINNNVRLGFLPNNSPVIFYHKRDSRGSQQLWISFFKDSIWVSRQLTSWNFVWNFDGEGSLEFKIELGIPRTTSTGISIEIRRDEEVLSYSINKDLKLCDIRTAVPWNALSRRRRADGLLDRCEVSREWEPEIESSRWFVSYATVPDQRDRRPRNMVPATHPLTMFTISEIE